MIRAAIGAKVPPMLRSSRIATALLATCVSLTIASPAFADAPSPTFRVLHDDHIGALALPAGSYSLTTFGGLTNAVAAQRFTRFLQDFDGKLPAPWTLDAATATFTDGAAGFQVAPAAPGTPATTTDTVCPGVFVVEHDDRIGGLPFPAGSYQLTSLRSSCRQNMASFKRLLARAEQTLPAPWQLNGQTGTFSTPAGARFRVKELQS
jgi:hypothetical protein